MERLTQHLPVEIDAPVTCAFADCPDDMPGCNDCLVQKLANRLSKYEDTGLTPAEVAEMKERQRWIPVSERLPVESEFRDKSTGELIPLLVCVEGTEFPFRALYDGKSWGDGWNKIDAKYWMPLPQPPKEEK